MDMFCLPEILNQSSISDFSVQSRHMGREIHVQQQVILRQNRRMEFFFFGLIACLQYRRNSVPSFPLVALDKRHIWIRRICG